MLLCGENFKRLALDIPDLVDVEDDLRLEVTHLGLMRLEQKYRRRGIVVVGLRLMAHRLGYDARLLSIGGSRRMIDIVGIFQRVGQYKTWVEFAVDVDQPLHMCTRQPQRIIAGVEKLDLGAECGRGAFRLILAAGLDLLKRHARLLPGKLRFTPLAKRKADDLDAVAASGVKRDRPACPPDEIAWMRRNHQTCLCHDIPLIFPSIFADAASYIITAAGFP